MAEVEGVEVASLATEDERGDGKEAGRGDEMEASLAGRAAPEGGLWGPRVSLTLCILGASPGIDR